MARLADVVALLHDWYPPETADDWDAVGLTAGRVPCRRSGGEDQAGEGAFERAP